MAGKAIVVASILCLTSLATSTAGAQNALQPPFDPGAARGLIGRQIATGPCQEPPPPLVALNQLQSRYDPKDPTQSKVDPARDQQDKQRTAALNKMVTDTDRLADRYLISKPPNEALAACVVHRISVWAKAGALLQGIDDNDRLGRHQALMTQAWYGAGLASAMVKLGSSPSATGEEANAARVWLHMMAKLVQQEYGTIADWLRPDNNHKYWAGYFLGITGVLTEDRDLFDSSMDILHGALDDVGSDGSLAKEMGRGGRSLSYQQFATLPIVAMAVLAERNHEALSDKQWDSLERLMTFSANAALDPQIVQAKTGVAQEPGNQSFNFAWIDMILPTLRPRDPELAARLERIADAPRMRPAWHIYLGGDVTAAYDPAALVPPKSP